MLFVHLFLPRRKTQPKHPSSGVRGNAANPVSGTHGDLILRIENVIARPPSPPIAITSKDRCWVIVPPSLPRGIEPIVASVNGAWHRTRRFAPRSATRRPGILRPCVAPCSHFSALTRVVGNRVGLARFMLCWSCTHRGRRRGALTRLNRGWSGARGGCQRGVPGGTPRFFYCDPARRRAARLSLEEWRRPESIGGTGGIQRTPPRAPRKRDFFRTASLSDATCQFKACDQVPGTASTGFSIPVISRPVATAAARLAARGRIRTTRLRTRARARRRIRSIIGPGLTRPGSRTRRRGFLILPGPRCRIGPRLGAIGLA